MVYSLSPSADSFIAEGALFHSNTAADGAVFHVASASISNCDFDSNFAEAQVNALNKSTAAEIIIHKSV